MGTVAVQTVVRDATPGDFEAIRSIARAANEEFREPMGEALHAGYLANVLDVERRAQVAAILVAEQDGEIVGTITVFQDINDEGMPARFAEGTAGIRATAVSKAARGQGIGSDLVEAAIARSRAFGARAIGLHTATCMGAAMRLYERHGFRRVADRDYRANDYFAAGAGATLDALAFVLDLESGRSSERETPCHLRCASGGWRHRRTAGQQPRA